VLSQAKTAADVDVDDDVDKFFQTPTAATVESAAGKVLKTVDNNAIGNEAVADDASDDAGTNKDVEDDGKRQSSIGQKPDVAMPKADDDAQLATDGDAAALEDVRSGVVANAADDYDPDTSYEEGSADDDAPPDESSRDGDGNEI
jgi:hypothetical protein